jgi:hypothetical protein
MEIQALKLLITQDDINALLSEFPPSDTDVENLHVVLTPDGIVVQGEYPTMLMNVAFETLWEVKAAGDEVEARLGSVKVSGLQASMLRGVLLKTIRDMTAEEPGVQVVGEAIRVDLSKHTGLQKLRLRMSLRSVLCTHGLLFIEAGPPLI